MYRYSAARLLVPRIMVQFLASPILQFELSDLMVQPVIGYIFAVQNHGTIIRAALYI